MENSDLSLRDDHIIWHYMPFTKYANFLRTRSLYCNRADRFDDPTEGEWLAYIKALITRAKNVNQIKEQISAIKKRSYINSWRMSREQSIAMWIIHGNINESVAIKTSVGKLRLITEKNKKFLKENFLSAAIRRVVYLDKDKINKEDLENIDPLAVKHSAYKYEQEVRLILKSEKSSENPRGYWLKVAKNNKDFHEFIEAIYVNPTLSNDHWFVKLLEHTNKLHNIPSSKLVHEVIKTDFENI